ncbi:hypothetical protein T492DRAFT_1123894 [Pavlovales sp. CCMP2436]|nr:hypothetical protein T492DRAFT_1123894 [Pavlovales sp. CCMP2436]
MTTTKNVPDRVGLGTRRRRHPPRLDSPLLYANHDERFTALLSANHDVRFISLFIDLLSANHDVRFIAFLQANIHERFTALLSANHHNLFAVSTFIAFLYANHHVRFIDLLYANHDVRFIAFLHANIHVSFTALLYANHDVSFTALLHANIHVRFTALLHANIHRGKAKLSWKDGREAYRRAGREAHRRAGREAHRRAAGREEFKSDEFLREGEARRSATENLAEIATSDEFLRDGEFRNWRRKKPVTAELARVEFPSLRRQAWLPAVRAAVVAYAPGAATNRRIQAGLVGRWGSPRGVWSGDRFLLTAERAFPMAIPGRPEASDRSSIPWPSLAGVGIVVPVRVADGPLVAAVRWLVNDVAGTPAPIAMASIRGCSAPGLRQNSSSESHRAAMGRPPHRVECEESPHGVFYLLVLRLFDWAPEARLPKHRI